ncbi:MAG: aldehyde dehydrogenase family protein [Acholeplasma sp.]|nr:aldehyde dehydrogenase family protein [Acholeplasma sp.]
MQTLLDKQKQYFNTGETLSYDFRINALKRLKNAIINNQDALSKALYQDLQKNEIEAYSTEIGYVLHSIDFTLKRLKKWMRVKKVKTPLFLLNTKSYIMPEPLGTVLIIGPYNYPFQLVIEPLIGAIASGNTAILKASEYVFHTETILEKIIQEAFEQQYICLIKGDYLVNQQLVSLKFDHIFFTGSTRVGKQIYEAAAKNLVPVTLELGGKSPTIICSDANLKLAAQRIAFGKFTNAGQTCIAPDYIYVEHSIKEPFQLEMKKAIKKMYEDESLFTNVIERHQNRIKGLMASSDIYYQSDFKHKIGPTLLENVSLDAPIMQEEIFGPLLPILTFSDINEVISTLKTSEKPLALYLFTNSKKTQKKVFEMLSFGGGAINDTLMHVANPYLPFGGIGHSGIGHYHGRYSFDLFSKQKGFIKKGRFDLGIQYPPYSNFKTKLIKFFLK